MMKTKFHPKFGQLALGLLLLGAASMAAAQNAGGTGSLGGAVGNGINLANLIAKLVVAFFALGGLCCVGAGVWKMIEKGKDNGRGDDIKWSSIGYFIVGGGLLLTITWFAYGAVEALGGSKTDVGQTIQVGRN